MKAILTIRRRILSVDSRAAACCNRAGAAVADIYEPWDRLVPIVVLGRVLQVPANNILLRQFQYVAEDVGMGRYCWNAECRYCDPGAGPAGRWRLWRPYPPLVARASRARTCR
jgi:hypothetical protein